VAAISLLALTAGAAPGDLDPAFGAGGKVTTPIGSAHDRGDSVALQSDGKIVVGGFSWNGSDYDFALVRYSASGALDAGFGTSGKVTTRIGGGQDRGYSVALQSDSKIIVAGSSDNGSGWDFALVRYTASGALDEDFGTAGQVITPIGISTDFGQSVALQSDGRIVVAGYSLNASGNSDFALVRYLSNGALDATFGANGNVTTDIGGTADGYGHAVVVQSGNKLMTAG